MLSPALRYARAPSGLTFRPDATCVLWMPMQDDPQSAVVRDRSGNGNDGAITGATWAQTPNRLWYLAFDGSNQHVIVADDATLEGFTSFTVSCWIKPTNFDATQAYIGKLGDVTYDYPFVCYVNTSGYPYTYISKTVGGDAADNVTSTTILVAGTWAKVTTVYNGTNVAIYVNGASAATPTAFTGTLGANNNELWIGESTDGSKDFTGGIALPMMKQNKADSAQVVNSDFQQERHLFGI